MNGVPLIFAHLGHWYVALPVYLAPVVLIVAWLKLGEWREARRRRHAEARRTPEGSGGARDG